ncbi:helix-turn-helix transcriptional regulator [Devosia sp.]|uniref:helix-turn-helix domain-containing protein n=1 Tax=Devosia sp. TaxID=1871048 RepID=UPI001AC55F0E|nr:helix-turn-helix transcriptional regulator [Devosia sp.]MBN9332771.1 helix-turn-helix transcriptional regulator [Devosia sp.]
MAVTAFALAPQINGFVLVAGNVAQLRRSHTMSAESLADRVGWSVDAVHALEVAAKTDLSLDDIDALAEAFEVEPSALFA